MKSFETSIDIKSRQPQDAAAHTMATESLQQSIRRQLLSAAAKGTAAFEISGVLQLSTPLDVFFKDNNNQPACVSHCMHMHTLWLQPLSNAVFTICSRLEGSGYTNPFL